MVPTKMPLSTFSEGRGNALKYFACLLHNWFRFHQHERLHAYGTMDLSSIVRTASSPWTRSMACVQYHGLWLLMMRTPFCQCLRICEVLVRGTRKRVSGIMYLNLEWLNPPSVFINVYGLRIEYVYVCMYVGTHKVWDGLDTRERFVWKQPWLSSWGFGYGCVLRLPHPLRLHILHFLPDHPHLYYTFQSHPIPSPPFLPSFLPSFSLRCSAGWSRGRILWAFGATHVTEG